MEAWLTTAGHGRDNYIQFRCELLGLAKDVALARVVVNVFLLEPSGYDNKAMTTRPTRPMGTTTGARPVFVQLGKPR